MEGFDDEGNLVGSIDVFWKNKGIEQSESRNEWYGKSSEYWDKSDPSIDGVLGGYGFISEADISSSRETLRIFKDLKYRRCLDCGSGIGRIAKDLLIPLFEKVDILEQSTSLIKEAERQLARHANMGIFYNQGLQSFEPQLNHYDCVWIQWVLGYLTDSDLVELLVRLRNSLTESGVIVVKENAMREGRGFFYDREDNSLIRTETQFLEIFTAAGLEVVFSQLETNLPEGLFPVMTFALAPKTPNFV